MKLEEIQKVGVVGAGTMGNGIAHVFAKCGFNVFLRDLEQVFLDRARDTISKNFDREVKKGKISEAEKTAALGRIQTATKLEVLEAADFIIEAAPEEYKLKAKLFTELDRMVRPEVIFATNTSSLSITSLAAETRRADRFIGLHFMNPVPVMVLVEVIRGLATSDETFELTRALCQRLEKTPVAVNDSPGFVSNRVLMPMINEAIYCVMEGVGAPEAVDTVMRLGMNHPMGPLQLADFIGLDICLDIMEVVYEGFCDSKYRPCPLLKKMVSAGWLGRKAGKGFYTYT